MKKRIRIFALVVLSAWLGLMWTSRRPSEEENFTANEAQFRAKMAASLAQGQYEFTVLEDNAHFLTGQLFTLVIRMNPTELNGVIERRKAIRNPPAGSGLESEFKAPFHFDCLSEARLLRHPDLFLIHQNCDRNARNEAK